MLSLPKDEGGIISSDGREATHPLLCLHHALHSIVPRAASFHDLATLAAWTTCGTSLAFADRRGTSSSLWASSPLLFESRSGGPLRRTAMIGRCDDTIWVVVAVGQGKRLWAPLGTCRFGPRCLLVAAAGRTAAQLRL